MRKALFTVLAAGALTVSCTREVKPGFAVVIDPVSYNQAKAEIDEYMTVVSGRGLYPILLIDRWGVPDSIREALIGLYNDKEHSLEGCVLIGDIPVPMVRDAQHMASAFKMDQDAYPRIDTHIPSDRFYDCFDLKFDYLDQDSSRWYYYRLRADGAQKLNPTIYSARITPRDNERGERYEKLRRYMQRVNKADQAQNRLDHVLMFGGDGNLSGSFAARTDAKMEFYDQFPWMKDQAQSVVYMDYTRDKYIKRRLTDELQNPMTDYALLSHHGDPTIQYLSGVKDPLDILVTAEFSNYHPQTPLVSLDACYNGSFHLDDNIQEAYLFGQGNGTLLVLANSVNAIQDKWVNRYTGLMGMGMRAGYLAKYGTFMEFHLFGDPTYSFKASADPGFDINDALFSAGDSFWKKQLDNPYPAVQQLAVHMLADSGPQWSDAIMKRFGSSESGMVRLACLMELSRFRDDNFKKCIILSLDDEHEMTQRFGVLYAGRFGHPDLVDVIADLRCRNNLSERVDFDLWNVLRSFDSTAVFDAVHFIMPALGYYTNHDSITHAMDSVLGYYAGHQAFDIRKALKSTRASAQSKLNAIHSIRNNPPHYYTDDILDYLTSKVPAQDSVIQKAAWEAIGWFDMSYRAPDIAEAALKVYQDKSYPVTVRNEALKTHNRTK